MKSRRVVGKRRGIALMMGLLFTALILVLGVSMLELVERDNNFQSTQDQADRALYLAHAGLNYYRLRSEFFVFNVPLSMILAPGQSFSVVVKSTTGDIVSTGVVADSAGKVKAQRILTVPGGNFPTLLDSTR